jgi:hypothetical protein
MNNQEYALNVLRNTWVGYDVVSEKRVKLGKATNFYIEDKKMFCVIDDDYEIELKSGGYEYYLDFTKGTQHLQLTA